MTKIVYADPNISPDVWTPPRGVIVLPLAEHPAIVEETARPLRQRRDYRWQKGPRPSLRKERVVDHLRTHGPSTAKVIAGQLKTSRQNIDSVLNLYPDVFERVGEIPAARISNRWKTQSVWGLVE